MRGIFKAIVYHQVILTAMSNIALTLNFKVAGAKRESLKVMYIFMCYNKSLIFSDLSKELSQFYKVLKKTAACYHIYRAE